MHKNDCIFCKIVNNELPSYKIFEDDSFLAILDLFPNTKGMTLVITKQHYDSYVFEMPDDVYSSFLLTAKKIGRIIDKKLNVSRTAMVMEGMGVNHAHIKLYPLHGVTEEFKPVLSSENKFYEKYEGYLSTHMGPKADDKALKELQEILTS